MKHRMRYEEQILDVAFRKKVIDEIRSSENQERKNEHLRRYEVYKDKAKKWVVQSLKDEGLEPTTVAQMENRAANISICKKIVNKKARVYKIPPMRTWTENPDDPLNEVRESAYELLDFDSVMKKADRYRELHKNCMVTILPRYDQPSETDDEVFKLTMEALPPWKYDVIEDMYDREKMRCLIISDFSNPHAMNAASEQDAGIHKRSDSQGSNGMDDIIADDPRDARTNEFVWWTSNYHFTTDEKGEVITKKSPDDLENPIGMIPAVNNSAEQDGQFWAEGGDDLVDGSILINKLLTDLYYVEYLQGFGQMVITGKNISKQKFKVGPNNVIMIDYETDDPAPSVDIVSANPPIADWISSIEVYAAMLLTTNNLSPGNVSATLSISNVASGIALMIELAEVTDDITEKHSDYAKTERKLDTILFRWNDLYTSTDELNDDWKAIGPLEEIDTMTTKFHDPKPPISETEKLNALKARKELGINEMIDLIMLDNPDMTREDAEQKLMAITEEKLKAAARFMQNMGNDDDESQTDDESGSEENEGDVGDSQKKSDDE